MSAEENNDLHNSKKESLLSSLLTAVQGCQVRFGGRAELATETDDRVASLCTSLESALSYGLKPRSPNRGLAAIKQVKDIVSSGLNLHLTLPGGDAEAPVLWWYVRELLTRHEYERFLLLKNVNTDLGRGRAWMRSLLNEHSLERYMHILVCDEKLLLQWYEPWALLRDMERAAMLPNLAAGLDSILFAISIDNSELNGSGWSEVPQKPEAAPVLPPEPEAQIAEPSDKGLAGGSASAIRKRELRKKKKKIPSQLISFDDELSRPDRPDVNSPLYHSAPTTCLSSPAPTTAGSTPYADRLEKLVHLRELQQAKEALKTSDSISPDTPTKSSKSMGNAGIKAARETEGQASMQDSDLESSFHSTESKMKYDGESLNEPSYQQLFENILPKCLDNPSECFPNSGAIVSTAVPQPKPQRPNSLYDQETGSYKSSQSNLSADSLASSEGDITGTVLTPVGSNSIQGLIPVSPRGVTPFDSLQSDDNTSVNSYSQEVDDAAAAVEGIVGAHERTGVTSPGSFTSTLPSQSSGETTLTMEELKSAVLEISRARDAAEGRRMEVAAALTQEMETSSMLRAEIAHQQSQHQETIDRLNTKISTITRENELLKHQLKKYVGAVQLLRREGSTSSEAASQQQIRTPPEYRDYHEEAIAYETKLIQVAEMHGELMEFNERLHRLLRMREAQVRHFREELEDLRGPLPDDHDDEDELDETTSVTSDLDALSTSTAPRTLINIWIPTAFLTGTSADTHHVYQIYIRIRDDEWNVYRRFAQFYELHKQLKKKDPIVKNFDFPQKKTFGYKEEGVVEERRIRLQLYVRQVVNLLLTTYPQLASSPDKATLTSLLPFFAATQQNSQTDSGTVHPSEMGGPAA
ncbi:sorting nexin-29-like isoform X2 [Penaeus japonicus]|uniref:sorting nexin-29-like isoform X2 n=1 Tax=Penaeus japonicus TaxID=27405 RepID=UPI001C714F3C|nr:sorting nexin-29-like isoform X2 [Penaeus japonicus]